MDQSTIAQRVIDHLFEQGRAAMGLYDHCIYERCMYRTSEGLRCAVGCLIDDDIYTPDMENSSIHCDGVLLAVSDSIGQAISPHDTRLLSRLQAAHDTWAKRSCPPDDLLVSTLTRIAHDFNLNVTIPEIK